MGRCWALSSGFVLQENWPRGCTPQARQSQAPGVTGQAPPAAASKGTACARWSHSAIKWPIGERPRRTQGSGPGLEVSTGSGGGSGAGPGPPSCHSRPWGRSLQTDTSCVDPLHSPGLAWNPLPSGTHPPPATRSKLKRCVSPQEWSRSKGRSHGRPDCGSHPLRLHRGTHTAMHHIGTPGLCDGLSTWAWVTTTHGPARATQRGHIAPGAQHRVPCAPRDRIWPSETKYRVTQEKHTQSPSADHWRNPT